MKKNIIVWNEQVASARRNLSSRLFNVGKKYFGSSSKAPTTITTIDETGALMFSHIFDSLTARYSHTSPEMTLRRLADYSFMIRDYRFALQIYETLRKDFQQPNALKYLAGVLEMQAVCSLLLDNSKSADTMFENAIAIYKGLSCYGLETRVACLYHELVKTRVKAEGVITTLESLASNEDFMRGAVFYEECAVSYLVGNVRQGRKSAYFYVLAGEKYSLCGQVRQTNLS